MSGVHREPEADLTRMSDRELVLELARTEDRLREESTTGSRPLPGQTARLAELRRHERRLRAELAHRREAPDAPDAPQTDA
ncbi:hypothetical protein [Intrasporangium flavum]|uniref:hypothetical protein n=1 Tax=Intrasporangium flavum TaxID=1428657 RepID=UPI001A96CDCF|nr:hypothetical protein [Intrasporangium flavum]